MTIKYCHVIPPIWTVRHPDMAAGWLTQYLRHHGVEVEILDLNAELYRRETRPLVRDCWERLFLSMSPFAFAEALLATQEAYIVRRLNEMVERGVRVFGLLMLDATARLAGVISRIIRRLCPEAHIVVGGTGATSLYRLRRRYRDKAPRQHPVEVDLPHDHAIDSWVLGEGEQTLLELIGRLDAGQSLSGLRGLALTADGPTHPVRERALIKDLDALPHPTYEGFDLGLYRFQALPFQLSRGCAFSRCSHCGLRGYSRGFRMRSPEPAMAELTYLVSRYGIREFHFTDLAVNGDLEKLDAFCDRLIESGLDICWQSFVQIRGDMTPALMNKVVRSGCTSLNYGFESGSDAVLKAMRKPYSAEEASRVLRMTREAGGNAIINLMVGHPGETEEEFQRTLDFLTENVENISMVASVGYTSVPLHSPLLDECDAFGIDVDYHTGRWQDREGRLTREVRNDRVHRATERMRLLGIPHFESFFEPPGKEREEGEERMASLQGGPRPRVHEVQLATPAGILEDTMRASEPLIVRVAYEAPGPIHSAVFDLKIARLDGRTAFVTEPPTEVLRKASLARRGWMQMVLRPGELPEGDYQVLVRLHPMHSEQNYSLHTHRRLLKVRGEAPKPVAVLSPHTWTHHVGELPEPRQGPLRLVHLTDGAGGEPLALVRGQSVDLEVELDPGPYPSLSVGYRLLLPDGSLHFTSEMVELDPAAPHLCRWSLTHHGLPAGSYTLCVVVRTGDEEQVVPHHLEVTESLKDGLEGLADLATWCQWEILETTVPTADPYPQLATVRLHRHDAGEGPLPPSSLLTIDMTIAGLSRRINGLHTRVWISDGERVLAIARNTARIVSPSGAIRHYVHIQLNLQEGLYTLFCSLWDLLSERPIEPVWSFPLLISTSEAPVEAALSVEAGQPSPLCR